MLHHSLATGLEKDDFGATPIHDSAEQNQLECLHVFFNHSVNLDPKDGDGMTPLEVAEEKGHTRCVQFLLNPKQSFQESRRKSHDVKASGHVQVGLLHGSVGPPMNSLWNLAVCPSMFSRIQGICGGPAILIHELAPCK